MPFHVTQKVLFKHCDPAGIVFYPRYFEMINDAVEAFFDEVVGLPFETMHKAHGVPTVRIEAHFAQASRHGDFLEIEVVPTRLGGSSLDLDLTGTCGGEKRFAVSLTLVLVNKDMRSEPWPEAIRAPVLDQLKPKMKEVSHG